MSRQVIAHWNNRAFQGYDPFTHTMRCKLRRRVNNRAEDSSPQEQEFDASHDYLEFNFANFPAGDDGTWEAIVAMYDLIASKNGISARIWMQTRRKSAPDEDESLEVRVSPRSAAYA